MIHKRTQQRDLFGGRCGRSLVFVISVRFLCVALSVDVKITCHISGVIILNVIDDTISRNLGIRWLQ